MAESIAKNDIIKKLGYESFENIIDAYKNNVYSTAYGFTRNRHDAEDLSQEIFLLIYQNLPTFQFSSKFSTWVYTVAINRCLMYKRKEKRRSTIAKVMPLTDEVSQSYSDGQGTETDVIANDNKKLLYEALHMIGPKYSAVMILKYMQDLSVKEIGRILSLPEKTVETQLYRARSQLKERLKGLGYSAEEQ
ncbi:MAG: sigma-70 family RNA polymerase sigma factor [Clostridia bacterium]|nr:sigma-70 family RNA polymerase sigma factor [Clostridia bacterium]